MIQTYSKKLRDAEYIRVAETIDIRQALHK